MKTILVPTDLSALADSALRVAVDLARTYRAEIRLVRYLPFLTALDSKSEDPMDIASSINEQQQIVEAELQQVVADLNYPGISVVPITCWNESGHYEPIPSHRPDLLVLATHSASGAADQLFGSDAEHVVRDADCPVLVIRQAVVSFSPTNAVAAIDMDDALKQYWPPYPFDAVGHRLSQFVYVSTPNNNLVPDGVHAWMDELAHEKGITDYTLQVRQARTIERGILDYADERQADLIVLYTHNYTGLRHLLRGSVADDVLNHATVPVLIQKLNRTPQLT